MSNIEKMKAMICHIAKRLDKLHWERLTVKGKVPEGDWLNYTIKVTVKWIDQYIIEMYVQHISSKNFQL